MKCQLFILFLAMIGLFAATTIAVENAAGQQETESTAVQPSGRANFVMPKLFDFEEFREKFNKHYPNAAEIARRTKLFMARAFAVFISGIKYMYNKGTKFLKINPRSDWTQKERQASMNRRTDRQTATVDEETSDRESPIPAVDPEDVKRVLAEISEHEHEHPDNDAKVERINNDDVQQHQRKRRSADSSESFDYSEQRHHLSMDDLIGGSDPMRPAIVSSKYKPSVPSNNPEYEQLEKFGDGIDDDENEDDGQMRPISGDEARQIDQQAGRGNYLGFIMNSIKGAAGHLLGSSQHDDHQDKQEVVAKKPRDQIFLDYRSDGCFLPPKDQGLCGACYIFAATALVEYHHCKQTGDLVPFSEQYAIDCGPNRKVDFMYGCNGGAEGYVGLFYSNFGMELSVDYPYRGWEQVCPYPEEIEAEHMGHTRMNEPELLKYGEDVGDIYPIAVKIEKLLKEKGPLFVSVTPDDDFSDFGGGIDVLNCDLESPAAHSMLIVGHGLEDGIEYWLIRNSYGVKYGVEGYYKLAKNSKEGCIVRVGYVRGQFKRNISHRRKNLFDELRDKNLLEQFRPTL